MATSVKKNLMNQALISNLEQALIHRKESVKELQHSPNRRNEEEPINASTKPVVLITNGEGIESSGLTFLVHALLKDSIFYVYVCAPQLLYSGAVAGAREALICGVASLCISLKWEKNGSCESELKHAVSICLPLIRVAVRDIQIGIFPKNCFLNIGIPSHPLRNKGVKMTRESSQRSCFSWKAVTANKNPSAGHYMSNQQSLGIMLAQLGRDASAAAASRRINSTRKNEEIESVGVAGKQSSQQIVKKFFQMEVIEKEHENIEDDLDSIVLKEGFVSVTPMSLCTNGHIEIQSFVSSWLVTTLKG